MSGVKNHLDSPDEKVRLLGMIVAEELADLVKFADQKEKSVIILYLILVIFFRFFYSLGSHGNGQVVQLCSE